MITTAKRETFFATDSPITLSPAPGQYYKHVDLRMSPSPWLEKQEAAVQHAALLERAKEESLAEKFQKHQAGAKRSKKDLPAVHSVQTFGSAERKILIMSDTSIPGPLKYDPDFPGKIKGYDQRFDGPKPEPFRALVPAEKRAEFDNMVNHSKRDKEVLRQFALYNVMDGELAQTVKKNAINTAAKPKPEVPDFMGPCKYPAVNVPFGQKVPLTNQVANAADGYDFGKIPPRYVTFDACRMPGPNSYHKEEFVEKLDDKFWKQESAKFIKSVIESSPKKSKREVQLYSDALKLGKMRIPQHGKLMTRGFGGPPTDMRFRYKVPGTTGGGDAGGEKDDPIKALPLLDKGLLDRCAKWAQDEYLIDEDSGVDSKVVGFYRHQEGQRGQKANYSKFSTWGRKVDMLKVMQDAGMGASVDNPGVGEYEVVQTPSSRTDLEKNDFLTKMRNKATEAPPLRSKDAIQIKKHPNRAPEQSSNKRLGYETPVPGGKGLMTLDVKGLLGQTKSKDMNISDRTRAIINLGIYEKGKYKPKNEEVRKAVDDLEKHLGSMSVVRESAAVADAEEGGDDAARLPGSKELHRLYESFRSPPEMPPIQSERSLVWQTRAAHQSPQQILHMLKNRLELALELNDRDVATDLKYQVEKAEVAARKGD
jgi:hypothetical protein